MINYRKLYLKVITVLLVCSPMIVQAQSSARDYATVTNPLNPSGRSTQRFVSLGELSGNIAQWMLSLFGIGALVVFIIGGFMYLSALGNPDKIRKATKVLVFAVIGIVVAFGAYAILDFVITPFEAPELQPESSGTATSPGTSNIGLPQVGQPGSN